MNEPAMQTIKLISQHQPVRAFVFFSTMRRNRSNAVDCISRVVAKAKLLTVLTEVTPRAVLNCLRLTLDGRSEAEGLSS